MQNNGQPRPWADVAASEQFRALAPERQERARQLYFEQVVLPRVPAGRETRARELYDQDTLGTISQPTADQGEVGAMDFVKEAGAGLLKGTGAIVSGVGDMIRPDDRGLSNTLPDGTELPKIKSLRELAADAIDPAARAAGGWLDEKGQVVADSKSQAAKDALAKSTPTGDVLAPETWDFGEDPSAAGYGLQMAGLVGQFAPQAGVLISTRGKSGQAQSTAMMATGGLQAGGAAANEVEQRIQETPDAELQKSSEVYRALREKLAEPEARAELALMGRDAAFSGAAPVGAVGGLATQFALGPLQRIVGGGVGRRLGYGLAIDAPVEGLQEVTETVAARASTNEVLGEQRSLTADTFGDAVLGALGGAGHASLGAAMGEGKAPTRQQGEADADFENTPEPAALPAPGLAGLPPPEQVFYGDSQGNVQDTGPVRNVDGEQQPAQQARNWVNPQNDPANMGGGPGMDQQTPRGEPAPLEGQLQLGARQQQAEQQRGPLTIDAEPERAALPAPETILVDGQGNAQRGPVAPKVPSEQVQGGRGMDQQAPTAPPRDRSRGELLRKPNGKPFDAPKGAEASKAFRDARAAGREPRVIRVQGGYAIQVQPEQVQHEMRPLDMKANEAATSPTNELPAPTAAQIEAGNYKKGKVRVHGLELSIENPRGSERSGRRPDGSEWRHTMSDHYGYIRRTTGADGEQVDVYLGPQEESGQVFVVDQLNQQDGSFDEHKVMIGFPDQESAVAAYRSNFDADWQMGKVSAMPVAEFKQWLKGGDLAKPAAPAQQEPRRAKPVASKGPRRNVDRDRDSLLQATIRLGGLKTEWREDTTGDSKGNKHVPGVGALWSDKTGTSIDDMASLLDQHGYIPAGEMDNLGGVPWLQQALRDELNGTTHFAAGSKAQQEQMERELQQRYADEIEREQQRFEAYIAQVEEEHGVDVANRVREHLEAAKAHDEQLLAEAQRYEDEYDEREESRAESLEYGAGAAGREAVAGEPLRQADGGQDRQQRAPARPGPREAGKVEPFGLEQQTERSLTEQAAQQRAAEQAEAEARRQAEQKAQADRDRADFTLTGSDRAADVGAARGQNDMFAPRTRGEAKSKIEDSGDSLYWNRKNPWRSGGLDWNALTDKNPTLRAQMTKKSNVWAKPDWEGVLTEMLPTVPEAMQKPLKLTARLVKQVYDALPAAPRKADDASLQAYISAVAKVKEAAESLLADPDQQRRLLESLAGSAQGSIIQQLKAGADNSPIFKALFPAIAAGGRFSLGTPENDLALALGGNKTVRAMQWSTGDVSKALKSINDGWPAKQAAWQKRGLQVIERGDVRVRVGRASESRFTAVLDTPKGSHIDSVREEGGSIRYFPSEEAARIAAGELLETYGEWLLLSKTGRLLNSYASEEEATEGAREQVAPKRRSAARDESVEMEGITREGPDRREDGENITGDQLMDAFGFRGVNFGKYVPQAERQAHLNHAYDAFYDLADVLGVPPQAISLNGMLGIAFGAQGNGGRAAAHFVPGVNEINLTRNAGAGVVAHEWAHALDHHFGIQAGMATEKKPYASHGSKRGSEIRPEVSAAIRAVVQAMNHTEESEQDVRARQRRNYENAQQSFEDYLEQFDFAERVSGTPAAVEALSQLQAGQLGDYVSLPSRKRMGESVGANVKIVADALGLDRFETTDLHGRAASLHYSREEMEGELRLRQIHTDFYRKSSALDGAGSSYWATPHEMFARAFEGWVFDQLQSRKQSSGYLVKGSRRDKGETDPDFPYPAGVERQAINKAFTTLMEAIDTRETEEGVQLYRQDAEQPEAAQDGVQVSADQLREALKASPELAGVEVVQDFEDLPLSTRTRAKRDGVAPQDLRGVRSSGKTYVVAGNHGSLADAIYTAVHEEVGHRGIRGLLGDELDTVMERLYSSQQATAKGRQRIGQIRDAYASVLERLDAKQQRVLVAQEMVAHLLEDGDRPTMLQRVLSKIRQLLRQLFPQVPWTYTDILALGEQSRAWLRRQKGQQNADRAVLYSRRGWSEEFPDTVLAHPLSFLNNHPDYAAAKAGDDAAALRVARDAVTPEFVEQVRALIPEGSQPRIVPVLAVEGAGKNRIPLAAAEVLAQRLGLEVESELMQQQKIGRTSASALERIAKQPTFVGEVAGGDFLILDDTLTQGGTLAQLKTHIEDNGGRVLGAVALTGKNYSRKLSLDPSTLAEVRGKYGSIEPWWRDTFGYGYEGLTQSEARTLLTFDKGQLSPERLRDRIAAARDEGLFRVDEGAAADRSGTEAHLDPDENLYSLAGARRPHVADAHPDLNADEQDALRKIAPRTVRQRAIDWYREHTDRLMTKLRRGLVDKYAALKEMDEELHGADFLQSSITSSAWVLARMAPAAAGALNAMMHNGRIVLDQQQKVIGMRDDGSMGLGEVFSRLGDAAEIERFMGWIAGNRAAKLAAEGRENLFDAKDIAALKGINRGTTSDGRVRAKVYDEVFREFQQYRDDVLAIAEQTGIISPESRAMWRDEFYVPFYRVMDEEAKAAGPRAAMGLSRQEAYKKLKGGKQNLNDLLENTLMNFHHLLTASLKNQAAQQAITNAEQLGIAKQVPEAARDPKSSTFVLKAGERVFYQVDDALVFEALTSLADPGLNNFAVRAMAMFKRVFTNMTTITPQFILANFLRNSMQAAATTPVSKNVAANMFQGIKGFRDEKVRAQMLASGGAFSFGHIYGADPEEVKAGLGRGLRGAKLVDGPKLVPKLLVAGWDAYNSFANTAENANRAAAFLQNQEQGTLRAAYEARDLMDFSQEGAWPAVRFLIRVVPFLNARLQGLDKLYRAGGKPAVLVAFGKGTDSDRQAAARFGVVTGALALASVMLYLSNHDDEEYRKLEDWQKDSYWFFRIGDQAFFVPKPFEVGAVSTLAERLAEQAIDDKASGKLFRDRLWAMVTQTFAFSPVPQAFQPALDVYSNKDAFTGRPIESAGMEKVSPTLRARASTTAPAHLISEATSVLGDDFTLSPLQADHLIQGYLGQVGGWGAGIIDTIWRTAKGEDEPAKRWHEYQPIRRFYKDLGAPAPYDRYSTLFYEGLKESGRVYADVKRLQELGRMDEARELVGEKRDILAMRKPLGQVQRQLSAINARMDIVRLSAWDGERKRRELDRLQVIKNRLTEMAGKRIETVRADD